jgi:hypothetical protein
MTAPQSGHFALEQSVKTRCCSNQLAIWKFKTVFWNHIHIRSVSAITQINRYKRTFGHANNQVNSRRIAKIDMTWIMVFRVSQWTNAVHRQLLFCPPDDGEFV